jgi:hypothetical protein
MGRTLGHRLESPFVGLIPQSRQLSLSSSIQAEKASLISE